MYTHLSVLLVHTYPYVAIFVLDFRKKVELIKFINVIQSNANNNATLMRNIYNTSTLHKPSAN